MVCDPGRHDTVRAQSPVKRTHADSGRRVHRIRSERGTGGGSRQGWSMLKAKRVARDRSPALSTDVDP